MSAKNHRFFPEGLRHAEAKKGKPQYDAPLCFVPSKGSSKEDTDDKTLKTVTVELSQKTTQKVSLYEYDDIEAFLQLQKLYDYYLSQQDVRRKHAKLMSLTTKCLRRSMTFLKIPRTSLNLRPSGS